MKYLFSEDTFKLASEIIVIHFLHDIPMFSQTSWWTSVGSKHLLNIYNLFYFWNIFMMWFIVSSRLKKLKSRYQLLIRSFYESGLYVYEIFAYYENTRHLQFQKRFIFNTLHFLKNILNFFACAINLKFTNPFVKSNCHFSKEWFSGFLVTALIIRVFKICLK